MVFFKKGELGILWPFYLASFIGYVADATSFIWVVYFLEKGFSLFEVSLTMGIIILGMIIFEIPTGALADILGRKRSVIIGWFAGGLIWILIPFMTNFYWLVCVLIAFAFAVTLISGAQEAWVIDLLDRQKRSSLSENYFINDQSISNLGVFLAGFMGMAVIALLGMDWLFYIAGIGMSLGAFSLIFAEDDKVTEKESISELFTETINVSKQAIKYVYDHKILFYLTFGNFFAYLTGVASVAWQPYFLEQSIPVQYFTLLGSAGAIIAVFAPHLVKTIRKRIPAENYVLAILAVLTSAFYLAVYFIAGPIFAIVAFIVTQYFLPQIAEPLEENYFQRHSVSKMRAAIGSTKSMVNGIPSFISLLVGGGIAEWLGPKYALVSAGVIVIPGIIFYYLAKK